MTASEILTLTPDDTASAPILWFRENERPVYSSALAGLAGQKKLRPVFLQKKPVAEQVKWMLTQMRTKQGSSLAEHLLQLFFMKAHKDMLATFCDKLGIENDEGTVEGGLPDSLDAAKVKEGVDALLADNDASLVALYLRVFQIQRPGGWPEVAEQLEARSELS